MADHSHPPGDSGGISRRPPRAAGKLDFQAWLKRLNVFKRRIATRLAMGDSTKEVAEHFHVTAGRISQLRREFKANWELFQGVPAAV